MKKAAEAPKSVLVLSFCIISQVIFSLQALQLKSYMRIPILPRVLHALPISFYFIILQILNILKNNE